LETIRSDIVLLGMQLSARTEKLLSLEPNVSKIAAKVVRVISVFVSIISAASVSITAMAVDVVKPFESPELMIRNAYAFEILTEALRRTVPKYGSFKEIPFKENLSVNRSQVEALKGNLINLLISNGDITDFHRAMLPIPFPIDKGLLGYRISFIRKVDQDKFDSIKNIDQLRSYTVGQGSDWGDVPIYRYNKIDVETVDTYDGLFRMLAARRFDLFPRGVIEATDEYREYGPRYPTLQMETHLLIIYPYANFFYVNKRDPRLAKRIQDGLEAMQKDGSFDKIFNKYFSHELSELNLANRTVINLINPFLPSWYPSARSDLWINPRDYKL
jgi:ABC-type amino acid transport substrate-binding protein